MNAQPREWFSGLADLLFPRPCAGCSAPAEDSGFDYLCADCAGKIRLIRDPACSTCGYPFLGRDAVARLCPHCVELEPDFSSGTAVFVAKGVGRKLVHELKYHRGLHLQADLARLFAGNERLKSLGPKAVFVPIPLHPRKLRERGFNQSEILARAAASCFPGARVENWLVRVSDSPTQTFLNRDERKRNLKNAFAPAENAGITANTRILIVDDVFTTGATLNSACRVLRRAGACDLHVLTLGHG